MMRLMPPAFLALALAMTSLTATAQDMPPPIEALQDRGATIGEAFDAPGGLIGYTVSFQGQTLAAYVTEDETHVVVGTLLDETGTNLSQPVIDAAQNAARPESEWEALADANWIVDGDAERVIYAFMDPNCPFCHRFYEDSRDWVEAGEVEIRHVMVGVLREDSLPKSATLLAADDPAEALAGHERNFDNGGITPADSLTAEARARVESNNELMSQLGIRGTPSVFYRTDDGEIALARGLPRDKTLEAVMGGPRPD